MVATGRWFTASISFATPATMLHAPSPTPLPVRLCCLRFRLQCGAQLLLLLLGERSPKHARLVGLDLRQNLVGCGTLDQHEQGRRALRNRVAETLDEVVVDAVVSHLAR